MKEEGCRKKIPNIFFTTPGGMMGAQQHYCIVIAEKEMRRKHDEKV